MVHSTRITKAIAKARKKPRWRDSPAQSSWRAMPWTNSLCNPKNSSRGGSKASRQQASCTAGSRAPVVARDTDKGYWAGSFK